MPTLISPSLAAPGEGLWVPAGGALTDDCKTRVWRIHTGCLVVSDRSRDRADGVRPLYLARVGDLVCAELLTGEPSPPTVQALAGSALVALHGLPHSPSAALLGQALSQARRQSREFLQLRTGLLRDRVQHLLRLLGLPHGRGQRVELPTLRQLAQLLDASPEAVCRVLSGLRQGDGMAAPPRALAQVS